MDRKVCVYDLVLEEKQEPNITGTKGSHRVAKQPRGDSAYDES